jgi:hypothetical protein
MHALLAVFLVAVLAACSAPPSEPVDPGPSGLTLATDANAYAPGATARLTFRNGTDADVSLAQPLACATVERETAGGWSPAPSERACGAALVPVPAGASATAEIPVPTEAGTYRATQTVYPGEGDGVAVASAPFAVR